MKNLKIYIIGLSLLIGLSGCCSLCDLPKQAPEVITVVEKEETKYHPTPKEPEYKRLGRGHIAEKQNTIKIIENTNLMRDYIERLKGTLYLYHIQTDDFFLETNSTKTGNR